MLRYCSITTQQILFYMNLRDLKYIAAVAKEENFARAAKKSFVSQPTLSMQIKKFEEELKITMFERSQKQFLVTEVGKKIIRKIEVILKEVEEIKEIAKNSSDPKNQTLTIGAFPTLASYYFPEFVNKISRHFPKLKLLLVEEKTEILINKLKDGEIDLALLAMPIENDSFSHVKIFEENFLLAVPKNHELAKKREIKPNELANRQLMLLAEGHCLRDQALDICTKVGAYEQETFRATSLETLRQMVMAGSGITLIPEIAAIKNSKISYIKINKPPKRVIGAYYRKGSTKVELIDKILSS